VNEIVAKNGEKKLREENSEFIMKWEESFWFVDIFCKRRSIRYKVDINFELFKFGVTFMLNFDWDTFDLECQLINNFNVSFEINFKHMIK
jgi:hypothetical protein